MSHPLAGIRILDLTRLLPGGVCTMMLGDLGAEIIKIEDPNGGDYVRWMGPQIDKQGVYFRMNNRSKRSVILDLKVESGQAALKKLVETADVLIEGFRPGVMTRLSCDYETLKTINPKLIYCSLSGWGVDGPYAMSGNHDLNYVSIAGLTGAMGTPQVIGGQVADIGGAYIGVAGILAALFRRERSGEGAYVDTSLAESALPFVLYNWVEALTEGAQAGKGTLSGGQACYHVYTTGDGRSVALGALEPKFWANFCNALNRPDLIEDYLVPERQAELIIIVADIFAQKTADEWNALLSDKDCCFTLVKSPAEIADDPHLQARKMLGVFDDGTPWMRSPIRISDSEPHIENVVPAYGADTENILKQSNISDDRFDAAD